jgi:hypothetical protein
VLVPGIVLLVCVLAFVVVYRVSDQMGRRLDSLVGQTLANVVSTHKGPVFNWWTARVRYDVGAGPVMVTVHTGSSDVVSWTSGTSIEIGYDPRYPGTVIYIDSNGNYDDMRLDFWYGVAAWATVAAVVALAVLVIRMRRRRRYRQRFRPDDDAVPATFIRLTRKHGPTRMLLETASS